MRSAAVFITSLSFAIDGPDYLGHPAPEKEVPPLTVTSPVQ